MPTSHSKPLLYDPLKTVIKYMNVNKRLQIAQRCPSLRVVEKLTPLKLSYLHIKPRSLQLDETKYEISSIKRGVVDNENDQNGLWLLQRQEQALPEELLITSEYGREERKLINWNGIDEVVRSELSSLRTLPPEQRTMSSYPFVQFLIAYQLGRPLPFLDGIKLSITNYSNGEERSETVKYNRTVYDASKYLFSKFLSRKEVVTVNTLFLDIQDPIRLPSMLKIRAQSVIIKCHPLEDLSPLESLIDMSNLETSVEFIGKAPYNHPFALRIPQLIVQNDWPFFTDRSLRIAGIEHTNVLFTYHSPEREAITKLVRYWLENGRQVETLFTFKVTRVWELPKFFKDLEEMPGVEVIHDNEIGWKRRLIFLLPGDMFLHVHCGPSTKRGESSVWYFYLEVKYSNGP